MRFLGWLLTVCVCIFAAGFFIDWFDVSKKDGVVSFHVNTVTIGHDVRATGKATKDFFEYLGNP